MYGDWRRVLGGGRDDRWYGGVLRSGGGGTSVVLRADGGGLLLCEAQPMSGPLVVSFGGGVNSAAMLIGMHERGIRPDLILFADTGGEKPETYAFVEIMRTWTERHMGQSIVRVSAAKKYASLEDRCLTQGYLPSIAYGFKSCSLRWKAEPQEKYANNWLPAKNCWEAGWKVKKFIGYDAGEGHRGVNLKEDTKYLYIYPLIEWMWFREQCIAAIQRAGLPVPVKSACFYCPSSRPHEIIALKKDHPDLFERAIAIERGAAGYNQEVKGLGRNWSWESLVAADEAQFKLFPEAPAIPCMCFDGEEE